MILSLIFQIPRLTLEDKGLLSIFHSIHESVLLTDLQLLDMVHEGADHPTMELVELRLRLAYLEELGYLSTEEETGLGTGGGEGHELDPNQDSSRYSF